MSASIVVKKVDNEKMMKEFIMLPWKLKIYDNDPAFIPPVILDQKKLFDPKKGYFFENGEAEFFIAYRDGKAAGRITAHINHLHEKIHDTQTGFFGFFECINDREAAKALFSTAEESLRKRGKTVMNGPQSFCIYDDIGVEVEGLNVRPVIGLFHHAPYYMELVESCGFAKAIDWGCYLVTPVKEVMPYLKLVKDEYMKGQKGIIYKTLSKKNKEDVKRRIEDIHHIFNKAWEGNYGHLPLTKKQLEYFVHELLPILKNELVIFAEKEGKTIGFIMSVPDVNHIFRILDGRLYPWRLVRALLAAKKTTRLRTMIMGVLPEYRGQKIDDVFYMMTIEEGVKLGFKDSDCSLIAETNYKMIGALKPLLPNRYKVYRLYEKKI